MDCLDGFAQGFRRDSRLLQSLARHSSSDRSFGTGSASQCLLDPLAKLSVVSTPRHSLLDSNPLTNRPVLVYDLVELLLSPCILTQNFFRPSNQLLLDCIRLWDRLELSESRLCGVFQRCFSRESNDHSSSHGVSRYGKATRCSKCQRHVGGHDQGHCHCLVPIRLHGSRLNVGKRFGPSEREFCKVA